MSKNSENIWLLLVPSKPVIKLHMFFFSSAATSMKWIDAKMKVSDHIFVVFWNFIFTMWHWTVIWLNCTLFSPKGGSVNQFSMQYLLEVEEEHMITYYLCVSDRSWEWQTILVTRSRSCWTVQQWSRYTPLREGLWRLVQTQLFINGNICLFQCCGYTWM